MSVVCQYSSMAADVHFLIFAQMDGNTKSVMIDEDELFAEYLSLAAAMPVRRTKPQGCVSSSKDVSPQKLEFMIAEVSRQEETLRRYESINAHCSVYHAGDMFLCRYLRVLHDRNIHLFESHDLPDDVWTKIVDDITRYRAERLKCPVSVGHCKYGGVIGYVSESRSISDRGRSSSVIEKLGIQKFITKKRRL